MRLEDCPNGLDQYQLRIRDLSDEGTGIVLGAGSSLVQRLEVGEESKVRLALPRDYKGPSGQC